MEFPKTPAIRNRGDGAAPSIGRTRRTRLLGIGIVVALVASLAGMAPAAADELHADGDNMTPVSTSALAMGDVCPGSTVTKDVLFGLERTSNGNPNIFKSGTSPVVSVVSASPAAFSASVPTSPAGANSITLPSNWSTRPQQTLSSDTATGRVTLVAPSTVGTVTGSVTFAISGTAQNDSALTDETALAVSARVVSCDTTPPTLHLPSSQTVEATGPTGAPVSYTVTATDSAPASPAVNCTPVSGATFPLGSTTVNCSSSDAAGNTATGSFTVTVRDTTGPEITGTPDDIVLEATGADGATLTYTAPTASDRVDGARTVGCLPASPAVVPLGRTTVTCTASDTRNNTSTSQFSVLVADGTAPTLVLPTNLTAEATSASGAAVPFTASATDAVDDSVAVTCEPGSGSTFELGTTTVGCSASDQAGNDTSGSFTVTVEDTTAPDLDLPASFVAEATGPSGAAVDYTASATDLVDGDVDVSCAPLSGSTFSLGATPVSCSATDEEGNSATGGFTVTVVDTTAPELSLPADVIEEGDQVGGKVVTFSASATDDVDGSPTVSCGPPSGSLFPVGVTTVRCDVTDVAGNLTTGSFTVTIEDSSPPEVTVPDDMILEATGPDGASATFTASALDVVDGDVPTTCVPISGSTFPIGTTTVTCSATDTAGNTGSDSFDVLVEDTTAPVVGSIGNVTAEATGPDGAVITYDAPTATDTVDGTVEVSCTPASGTTFALGDTEVTCSATDAAGNTGERAFTVTVSDTEGPLLSLPADITEEATGPDGARVTWEASASDVVDGARTVDCTPASGTTFEMGDTLVGCAASDTRRNESTGSFTVTVEDTTPPAITVPEDITAEATGPDGAPVPFVVSATDLVDGVVAVECDRLSDATFPLGPTTVTCEATDGAGNSSSETFDVTVVDTTAPVVTVPADMVVEATGPAGATVPFSVSALDAVDSSVVAGCDPPAGSVFALGPNTVTCTGTDDAGNTGSATFTVTVEDTTAPMVSVPSGRTLEATGPDGAVATFNATADDIVDGAVEVTCSPASGSTFVLGTTTVRCEAPDEAGNTGLGEFAITVVDTTAPSIGDVTDVDREATGPTGAVVTYSVPAGLDIVDGDVDVTCTPSSGSTFELGPNDVTCSAADTAGNKASKAFVVTITDTTEPALTLPGDTTVEATGPNGAVATFSATAEDLVDGPVPTSCVPTSGSTFALGETVVECTARDGADNEASGSFTVTVEDRTAPVVTVPDPITAEATEPAGAAVTYATSATDLVDGALSVSCSTASGPTASGSTFPIGTTTVTCEATDAADNAGDSSFTVTVRDTTAPTVSVPANRTVPAVGSMGAPVSFAASAVDIVDGSLQPTCNPSSGATFPLGTSTVACTATDGAGNTGTSSFGVTIELQLGGGFLSPVRPDSLNVVKGGSTVPLKWQVPNPNGGYISDTAIVSAFKTYLVSCNNLGEEGGPEVATTTGGTQLRYDTTANQFIQNWQTPKKPGACYRAEMQFHGGQKLTANFQLK